MNNTNERGKLVDLVKLDLLLARFDEQRNLFKSQRRDIKHLTTQKSSVIDSTLKKHLQHLNELFDNKFKTFKHVFQFFDLDKKG